MIVYSLNACMKFVSIVEEILWIHIKSKVQKSKPKNGFATKVSRHI